MLKKIEFGFKYSRSFTGCDVCIEFNGYQAVVSCSMMSYEITGSREGEKITLSPEDSRKVRELIEDACVETWYDKYRPEGFFVLDGYSWDLKYEVDKNKPLYKYGSNAYPWCFYKLIRASSSQFLNLMICWKTSQKKRKAYIKKTSSR